MTTTTYGYRNPDIGDLAKNSTGWFASLNYNITRYDAHNHDGVSSALITISNFAPYTQAILAAAWSTDGAGGYTQTVTVPAGVTDVSNYNVKFVFTAPGGKVGDVAYLGYTRVTGTTYLVHCNDNTAAFTAIYR